MGFLQTIGKKFKTITAPILNIRFSTGGRKLIEVHSVEQPIAANAKRAWKWLKRS